MSIPQICPNCGNHISTAHGKDCCFGTPEYAHLGWPNMVPAMKNFPNIIGQRTHDEDSNSLLTMGTDTASAIRRLLEYLNDEPDTELPPEAPAPVSPETLAAQEKVSAILCRLAEKCMELRKEANGIYLVEARAKRNFAADILEGLIEELQ